MIADEASFGYQDGGEQLADYAERFGLLFDRLRAIREVMRRRLRWCPSA